MSVFDEYPNLKNYFSASPSMSTANSTPAFILPEEKKKREMPLTPDELLSLGRGPIREESLTPEEEKEFEPQTLKKAKQTGALAQFRSGAVEGLSMGYLKTAPKYEDPGVSAREATHAVGKMTAEFIPFAVGGFIIRGLTSLPKIAILAKNYPKIAMALKEAAVMGGFLAAEKPEEGESRVSKGIFGAKIGAGGAAVMSLAPIVGKQLVKIPAFKKTAQTITSTFKDYQKELISDIKDIKLPKIELTKEWKPNNISYNNPYTKFAYNAWDTFKDLIQKVNIPGLKTLGDESTSHIIKLAKEKDRIIKGLSDKLKEETWSPLKSYTSEQKKQIGLMINKYIPVTDEYKAVVKDVDVNIGALGYAMMNKFNRWLEKGGIPVEQVKLTAETFFDKLGQQARHFYLRPNDIIENASKIIPPMRSAATGMFKHRKSLVDWAKKSFLMEGKVINTDLDSLGLNMFERMNLKEAGINTITQISEMTEQQLLKIFPKKAKLMKAEIDDVMRKQIEEVISTLGSTKETLATMAQNTLGSFTKYAGNTLPPEIKVRFGATERTLSHELGHLIDSMYGLGKMLKAKTSDELRQVADLRLPAKTSEYFKKYVRKTEEKVAEFVSLYLKDRDQLKQIAPNAFKEFEDFISVTSPLDKLLEITPTMIQGMERMYIDSRGYAKKIINGAKKFVKDYEVVELSKEVLDELGLKAKINFNWVYDADVMVAKTFRDYINQYANMEWLDVIFNDKTLFSTQPLNGFKKVTDLLPGRKANYGLLGPLNSGYIHPGLVDEITTMSKTGKSTGERLFNNIVGMWKLSKVGANLPTGVRNYLTGSFFQSDMAGMPVWNPKNAMPYIVSVLDYVKKGSIYKRARDAGQYGSSYFSVEISPQVEKELLGAKTVTSFWEKLNKGLETTRTEVGQYYGMIDHFARTYLFERAVSQGATDAQAVHFANKWQLDYKYVPKVIESLRNSTFFPFISYYYLMLPRIMEVGLTRPWVLMKYPIIIESINRYMASQMNMTRGQLEAMKPQFLEGEPYTIPVGFDNNGDPEYFNFGYIMPIGSISTGFIDIDSINDMIRTAGIPGLVIDLVSNRNSFKSTFYKSVPIWEQTDSTEVKRRKILEHSLYQISPSMVSHIINLQKAATGEIVGYPPYETKKSMSQALLRLLGINIYSGGQWAFQSKINDLNKLLKDYNLSIMRIRQDKNTSAEYKQKEEAKIMENMMKVQESMRQLMQDMAGVENKNIQNQDGYLLPLEGSSNNDVLPGYYENNDGWQLPPH